MVLRKRLLLRLYYGKKRWCYKIDCRWVESIPPGWEKPAHYIRKFREEPWDADRLFGYWFDGSELTGNNNDDWGFRVLQDGKIVYTDGTICEKRREYEFQLPEACLSELRSCLEAHRTEYLSHCIGTNRIGVKTGWQDYFTFLGFRFSAWHIFRHPEALLKRNSIPRQYLEDCLQENWMLDIFDEGRKILESYGFCAPLGVFSLRYITGIHALAVPPCRALKDASGIQWDHIQRRDAGGSYWGVDASIEPHRIPEHDGIYPVATHTQACLDLLELGDFDHLHGICGGLIGLDEYSTGFFLRVMKFRDIPRWPEINALLEKEYPEQWPAYRHWYDGLPKENREYAFQETGMRDWKALERILADCEKAQVQEIIDRCVWHPDLFGIMGLCILCNQHLGKLTEMARQQIYGALYFRPFQMFRDALENDADDTIDRAWMAREFLAMFDHLQMRYSEEERNICEAYMDGIPLAMQGISE